MKWYGAGVKMSQPEPWEEAMRKTRMLAAAVTLSAVLGALVIAVFLRYLRRNSLMVFVYYRIVFGIIVIALAFFRFGGG